MTTTPRSRRLFWMLVSVLAGIVTLSFGLLLLRAQQIAAARDELESRGTYAKFWCEHEWLVKLLPGTLPYAISGDTIIVMRDQTDDLWIPQVPIARGLPSVRGVRLLNTSRSPQDIGPRTFATFSEFPQLESLLLDRANVSDDDLAILADLSQLRHLSLDNTHVTGTGLRHLKDLQHLEYLSLDGTPLTEEGLRAIASLKGLTSLSISNTGLAESSLLELETTLPDLMISDD